MTAAAARMPAVTDTDIHLYRHSESDSDSELLKDHTLPGQFTLNCNSAGLSTMQWKQFLKPALIARVTALAAMVLLAPLQQMVRGHAGNA